MLLATVPCCNGGPRLEPAPYRGPTIADLGSCRESRMCYANDPARLFPLHSSLVSIVAMLRRRRTDQKKGADKGIDGRLYFHDERESAKTNQVIFSAKAGKTGPTHVRDLRGVVDREKAAIGVLISMQGPTQPMRTEAVSAGYYESPWTRKKHPKIQLPTIADLLKGKQVDMPTIQHVSQTFKKAPKAKMGEDVEQGETDYSEQ
jgi:hypothetical protein